MKLGQYTFFSLMHSRTVKFFLNALYQDRIYCNSKTIQVERGGYGSMDLMVGSLYMEVKATIPLIEAHAA